MDREQQLEQQLAAARARMDAAIQALEMGRQPDGAIDIAEIDDSAWDECSAARAALLRAQRELAAVRAEEHAVPIAFPVQWHTGAPLPQVVMNGHRAFLIFYVKSVDPTWDGSYTTVRRPDSEQAESLALVELHRHVSSRLGDPGYDVLRDGHPLGHKGLEPNTAQLVVNSRWLAELQRMNSVHASYRPEVWQRRNHYVFWFHDSTFECIAESFAVELHRCSIPELLAEACRRLVGTPAAEVCE